MAVMAEQAVHLQIPEPTDAIAPSRYSDDDLTEAFALFDVDASGSVTAEEAQLLLYNLGVKFTAESFDQWYSSVDADGSGGISYDEFVRCLKRNATPPDTEEESIKAFRLFVGERRELTAEALYEAVKQFDPRITPEEAQEAVSICGADGAITLDDWVRVTQSVGGMHPRFKQKYGCI
eukprot:TRINITY_DN7388_c0_g1_i2.p2 TRINITY_DN7388_c0_g1~~TRINITY_DN7388_c0_g1_i2.p2  ORF type:complete len:178 (+),score=47.17 TRINITY_DN7388_c0_g1_i2:114-647(+)